jgi:DNA-binding MarR family transcriptional regulator
MKKRLTVLIVLLFSSSLSGQSIQNQSPIDGIAFLAHRGSVLQVDFNLGLISRLNSSGWAITDSFETLPEPMRRLLHRGPVVNQSPDTTVISFNASGLVYAFTRAGRLQRLDQTFYSGYNNGAIRYFDGKRLWKLGGTGFWQVHDLALYFDPELREWERMPMTPSIAGGFTNGLYSAKPGMAKDSSNLVALIQRNKMLVGTNPSHEAYKIDLINGRYELLGAIAQNLQGPDLQALNAFAHYNEWSLIHHEESLYLADLLTNSLYQTNLRGTAKIAFNGLQGLLLSPQGVYSIASASTMSNSSYSTRFEPWSAFINGAEAAKIGAIYEELWLSKVRSYWKAITVFLLLVAGLIYLLLRYRQSIPKRELDYAKDLSPLAKIALKYLLVQPAGSLVSSEELNQILGIQDKAWDNQRKIRSTILSEIEEKGMHFLGVPSFVERVTDQEDRRIRRYRLKPELREDLAPILKYV